MKKKLIAKIWKTRKNIQSPTCDLSLEMKRFNKFNYAEISAIIKNCLLMANKMIIELDEGLYDTPEFEMVKRRNQELFNKTFIKGK